MKNTTVVGKQAEKLAAKYLKSQGFNIISQNYRDRFCEIDIIVCSAEFICFVEVKYRNTEAFGGGVGAVDFYKQQRIKKSAEYWLANNQQYSHLQPRIDVVAVDANQNIEIIENAIF